MCPWVSRKFLPIRLLLSVLTITHSTIHFVVESDALDVKEHTSNEEKPTVGRTEAVKNEVVKGQ